LETIRLINTVSLELESFTSNTPEYSILSHTWADGDSEVSFQEFTSNTNQGKLGWTKIRQCCERARKDGWKYVWIDTCCIDKTSSAELSEAINSMYAWYEKSAICYAYLADVDNGLDLSAGLQQSRWFTRGWTLQELLAPSFVLFLDRYWVDIGTSYSLQPIIQRITGIDRPQGGEVHYTFASVAQKFSWAAKRKTARVEDQAYCMLGILGIQMPLLYGEGQNAFRRLQKEIIKTSNDESIFAWEPDEPYSLKECGALAPSIDCFSRSSGIVFPDNAMRIQELHRSDFTKTKNGLRIHTLLYHKENDSSHFYCAVLNCGRWSGKEGQTFVGIYLLDDLGGTYSRTRNHKMIEVKYPGRSILDGWHELGQRLINARAI
jgi:Heterokaryon incompatibility protein (HET)